jgi:hypothetical protein
LVAATDAQDEVEEAVGDCRLLVAFGVELDQGRRVGTAMVDDARDGPPIASEGDRVPGSEAWEFERTALDDVGTRREVDDAPAFVHQLVVVGPAFEPACELVDGRLNCLTIVGAIIPHRRVGSLPDVYDEAIRHEASFAVHRAIQYANPADMTPGRIPRCGIPLDGHVGLD